MNKVGVGSVVRVAAIESPTMIVKEVMANKAECVWFASTGELQRAAFPINVLSKMPESENFIAGARFSPEETKFSPEELKYAS